MDPLAFRGFRYSRRRRTSSRGRDTGAGRRGDLDALDVVAVPERFEERVGEAEVQQVLDRRLAEVAVDAVDRRLVEVAQQDAVERPRRPQVPPERLLHDDAGAARAPGRAELL